MFQLQLHFHLFTLIVVSPNESFSLSFSAFPASTTLFLTGVHVCWPVCMSSLIGRLCLPFASFASFSQISRRMSDFWCHRCCCQLVAQASCQVSTEYSVRLCMDMANLLAHKVVVIPSGSSQENGQLSSKWTPSAPIAPNALRHCSLAAVASKTSFCSAGDRQDDTYDTQTASRLKGNQSPKGA